MTVCTIDPLSDPRWDTLIESHPSASVFHSRGWLEALRRTYGWQTIALTTTTEGQPLRNAWPVCRVAKWPTRKLVSLPFSDHCEPLVAEPGERAELLDAMLSESKAGWKSLELRPLVASLPEPCGEAAEYVVHSLDLRPPAEAIFRRFHESCTRRPIRRALREGIAYESGRSPALLEQFYRLFTLTRRRHGVPPPSFEWFRNLAASLGERFAIHLARKGEVAVAAIVTLAHRRTLTYKYGGSDARYHSLGVMPFLFWQAIQGAKLAGLERLDLGRSDLDQPGLIAFKDHLGAGSSRVAYYRYPPVPRGDSGPGLLARAAHAVFARMPLPMLAGTGRLLYPYFA